ncbi:hypothetical protein [Shimia gijangensis]|nr:hypothetical protein [Shimia gijangensis]
MADGTAPPSFFLSSLDPGVGKTTTLIRFVQQLLRSNQHEGVAVLLCFSQLDEIAGLIDNMELNKADFAVFTGKGNEINGLSSTPYGEARILFTTQEMVRKRCRGRSFKDTEVFHYQGEVRAVRVWDEAMLPGEVIRLNTDQLASLRDPLRLSHPAMAELIDQLEGDLKVAGDHSFFTWPDVEDASGTSLWSAKRHLHGDLAGHLERLYDLSGRCVRLSKSGKGSTVTTALDSRDVIPDDLAPAVILDASGRVRATYSQWKKQKKNLVRLPSATKSYQNLSVHVMNKGSGKTAWSNNGEELAQEVAHLIDTKPDEEWLVIHHKTSDPERIPNLIRGLMATDTGRISFLNWGRHQGTNAYRDIKNVILAGLNNYSEIDYEMLARCYSGIRNDQKVPKALVDQMRSGELRHHILQALCRSSVRQGNGSDCDPCNAYIIAPSRFGALDFLPEVFPGCTVRTWKTRKLKLKPTGWVADAVAQVTSFFASNPDEVYLYKDLRADLGITNASNFNKRVRHHESYKAVLDELEVEEIATGKGPHRNALAKKPQSFGPVEGAGYIAGV